MDIPVYNCTFSSFNKTVKLLTLPDNTNITLVIYTGFDTSKVANPFNAMYLSAYLRQLQYQLST